MHIAKKQRKSSSFPTESGDHSALAIRDRVLLHLARAALIIMLSVIGFLINDYLSSMHKTMDKMAASIEKISGVQDRLSVALARVDETMRHIERRMERIENKQP